MDIVAKKTGEIIKLRRDIDKLTFVEEEVSTISGTYRKITEVYCEDIKAKRGELVIPNKIIGINIETIEFLFKDDYEDITDVIISEGIKYIEPYALKNNKLSTITLPTTYVERKNGSLSNVKCLIFKGRKSEKDITQEDIQYYYEIGISRIEFDCTTLYK